MSEFRRDPLTGRWTIIAENRSARPNEYTAPPPSTASADCPFCEGNEGRTPPELAAVRNPSTRANARGWTVRTIPNRFPTVSTEPPAPSADLGSSRRPGFGHHEVIIESPRHTPAFSELPRDHVRAAVGMFRDRVRALAAAPNVAAVILFENFGPESGGTLFHPHAQVVALPEVPPWLTDESEGAARFTRAQGSRCALEAILAADRGDGRRIALDTEEFAVVAPFAAEHAYELRWIPSRHAPSIGEATDAELDRLAETLPRVLRGLQTLVPGASYNLVSRSFATSRPEATRFHWHLDLLPRLVRPDGFDVGSGIAVNPVAPETAAAEFRAVLASGSVPSGGDPPSRKG